MVSHITKNIIIYCRLIFIHSRIKREKIKIFSLCSGVKEDIEADIVEAEVRREEIMRSSLHEDQLPEDELDEISEDVPEEIIPAEEAPVKF